jgi:DNA-binding winged helix-turn-helix (wHTH) protein
MLIKSISLSSPVGDGRYRLMVFRFYAFKLDEQRRELSVGGRELRLQPRVFDVLAYLLRHRDRVVSKDELLQVLWPGMVVVDGPCSG